MEINYDISREELLAFHIKYSTKTVFYKNFIKLLYSYSFILAFSAFIDGKDIIDILELFIITILILFFIKKYLFLFCFKKIFSRRYRFEKYSSYFCSTKLIINTENLNLINEFEDKIYKWKSIINMYFIDEYILITTKSNSDILIPIKAFQSVEDKNLFISDISENCNLKIKTKYPSHIDYF